MASSRGGADGSLALTVHGPLGTIDLFVPPEAAATDVAREYAAQSGLGSVPLIFTRLGEPLPPTVPLIDGGVDTGDVLVATTSVHRPPAQRGLRALVAVDLSPPGSLASLWVCLAAGIALAAGWFAAGAEGRLHEIAVWLLFGAAVLGVLPLGKYRSVRAQAAPAFAVAGAFALVYDPAPEKLPMVLGIAALAGAVGAAVARSLEEGMEATSRVWIGAGLSLFAVTGLAAMIDLPGRAVWAALLVVAMLAARFVPMLAVDVPDNYLIDLDRLAITAWSAREQPRGRRGRVVVPSAAVAAVAERGAAIITGTAVAILAVTAISAPMLVRTATLPVDRVGARFALFLVGAALLLAGRSFRHAAARMLLRLSGLCCWVALAVALMSVWSSSSWMWVWGWAVGLGALILLAAVATGRGWRSARWSRRAEVAESICGSFALAAAVIAAGVFRSLWEITS